MRTVTIVGASLSGLYAARELRAQGYDGRLVVIGDEPHQPYDRPPLSKDFLTGRADENPFRGKGRAWGSARVSLPGAGDSRPSPSPRRPANWMRAPYWSDQKYGTGPAVTAVRPARRLVTATRVGPAPSPGTSYEWDNCPAPPRRRICPCVRAAARS